MGLGSKNRYLFNLLPKALSSTLKRHQERNRVRSNAWCDGRGSIIVLGLVVKYMSKNSVCVWEVIL